MGEVGVHLQHQAGAGLERPVESGDVGGAEAFLVRPPQNLDLLVPGGEPLGDLPGAVGRVVVDDQHPARGRHLGQHRLDDRLDVRPPRRRSGARATPDLLTQPRTCADAIRGYLPGLRLGFSMERFAGLDPPRDAGLGVSIPALIAEQARARPDSIAIEDQGLEPHLRRPRQGERRDRRGPARRGGRSRGAHRGQHLPFLAGGLRPLGRDARRLRLRSPRPRSPTPQTANAGGALGARQDARPDRYRSGDRSGGRRAVAPGGRGPTRLHPLHLGLHRHPQGGPDHPQQPHPPPAKRLGAVPESRREMPPCGPARVRPLGVRDLGDPFLRRHDRDLPPRTARSAGHRRADRQARNHGRDAFPRNAHPARPSRPGRPWRNADHHHRR